MAADELYGDSPVFRDPVAVKTGSELYSFAETMGMPGGLLSYKYYFPTYNNTSAPLNSQLRFGVP